MAKDILKLKDGSAFEIEDGATIGSIVHIADDETGATGVCALLSKDNVSHVEFWSPDGEGAYGVYDGLVLASQPTRQNEVGEDEELTGRVIVTISLREQSDLEKRVSDLEESQNIQDGAIADIGDVVSELAGE